MVLAEAVESGAGAVTGIAVLGAGGVVAVGEGMVAGADGGVEVAGGMKGRRVGRGASVTKRE